MPGTSPRLRVLILGLNFAPEHAGIAPYTAGLASGLAAGGHDVRVITTYPHYPQWRVEGPRPPWRTRERDGDVQVTRVRHYVPDPPSGIRRLLSELSFGVRVATTRWGRPDVVLCVSPALVSTAVALAVRGRRRRSPAMGVIVQDLYSVGVHETRAGGATAARTLAWLESWVVRRCTGTSVIHERFKRTLVDALGADDDAVVVIRNWTHVTTAPSWSDEERRRARERHGWRADEIIVLHTGAMGEKQGLSNVVAAARLADQGRRPLRFVLIGDGGQRRRLEQEAAGVTRIEFVDPLPDDEFVAALCSADILLVNELPGVAGMAVPSKLTSYFSSGRPVIAATEQHSTTAEEVRAAGAGVVVAPGAPQQLVDAVVRLGADPALSDEIGRRGPAYCARATSLSAALDSYERWVVRLAMHPLRG